MQTSPLPSTLQRIQDCLLAKGPEPITHNTEEEKEAAQSYLKLSLKHSVFFSFLFLLF